MDLHFWRDCPLLTECKHCSQVIEIETINHHLLHECEKSSEFKECPRCKESVHSSEFDSHVEAKQCLISKPPKAASRCGMCHQDVVPPSEAGWKRHILEEVCPKNPRKVLGKKK
jgi:centrosomal protein CEP104